MEKYYNYHYIINSRPFILQCYSMARILSHQFTNGAGQVEKDCITLVQGYGEVQGWTQLTRIVLF